MKKYFVLLTPIGKFAMWGHSHFGVKFEFVKQFPQVNEKDIFSFFYGGCPEHLDYQAYKFLVENKTGQTLIREIDALVGRLIEKIERGS